MTFRRRRIASIKTSQGSFEPRSIVINAAGEQGEHTTVITVRQEVIPVGMESTVIALPDYDQPEETFVLAIDPEVGIEPNNLRTLTAAFFGPALPNSSPDSRSDRIRAIIPFLADFTVATQEQDRRSGRYVLPKEISAIAAESGNSGNLPVPSPMKNLYLLQDSARALYRSLHAGNALAARLR
jgi:hypothetical protein